ncbi:MAG: 2-oxoacid:acceptor oxidoreductase subunit alpha [Acidaminococcaceae bacterium]|nr:2-oxoacid:acceptor oxidoreductase subunit alpha [Acidaminococcaceae bacterium]
MKSREITWQAGGQQGEGLESLGEILASALNHLGYELYGFRQFSSRIKGGHTNYKLRIAAKAVGTIHKSCDLLIALDKDTMQNEALNIQEQGIILVDSILAQDYSGQARCVAIPFKDIAQKHGSQLQKNIAALGCTVAVLGLTEEDLEETLRKQFIAKGAEVVAENVAVLKAGIEYIQTEVPSLLGVLPLPELKHKEQHLFILGNEAMGFGALSAGAKFMAAYPITPASEVMEYMVKKARKLGGQMLQVEDEIAACTMATGAAYGGARAFTATSGPGLSLMSETIGLAAMTETPLVIVHSQRGGPSTGLPTKHEQSDVFAALYNTHGDTAKIVLSPSTIEEGFYDTFEAFNLAEEYQCPVIVLADLQLSLGKQTMLIPEYDKMEIRRGNIVEASSLPPIKAPEYFPRYSVAQTDGISGRIIPGTPNGICLGTGLEHDESGRPTEAKDMRIKQTEKRLQKMKTFLANYKKALAVDAPYSEADALVIGMTSTRSCIAEVVEILRQEGKKINHVQVRLLLPFPAKELEQYIRQAKKIIVVEHNATAQLAGLIRMHIEQCPHLENILQYDGDIMYTEQLLASCKEVL